MPQVYIPPLLKSLADGADVVEVVAGNVRGIVEELERRFPGVRERLVEDGELKAGLTVAVDGNVSPLGLLQKVATDSEVHFLPAIGGG